ncbi:MAG TPA: Cof-type HAD-IIB family hydrolase [Stellaceae bacterium]|nr:Cof-type HAD-IIB family hydrolase [Stellaceae bacterium]
MPRSDKSRSERSGRRIELLLADVDGTLVTHEKVLTERAVHAVYGLHKAGIRFAITSGRPPRGMAHLIQPLALTTPIAAFNGGQMVDSQLNIIEARTLAEDLARQTLEVLAFHNVDAWVYAGEDWLIRDPDAPHVAREASTVHFDAKVVKGFEDRLGEVVKIVGVSDDHDLLARCEKDMQRQLHGRATAARSQPYYLDVTHKEANKGAVVDYLAHRLHLRPEAIATIGDQPNDLTMFRRGGFSIAMGNAPDEVKEQADAVTASCDEEGFAKAVETHLLEQVR